jgi:hypothetical protein
LKFHIHNQIHPSLIITHPNYQSLIITQLKSHTQVHHTRVNNDKGSQMPSLQSAIQVLQQLVSLPSPTSLSNVTYEDFEMADLELLDLEMA